MNYSMTPRFEAQSDVLTQKQLSVALWCVEGKTFEEIAKIIGCTRATVKKHLMNAAIRMGCGSQRAEITAHAISVRIVLLKTEREVA